MKTLGPAGVLAIIAATLPALSSIVLYVYLPTTADWLRSRHEAGLAIFVLGFALLAGLAIMPTYIQAALGGYAFGVWAGAPAGMAGIVLASVLGYEIAARVGRGRVDLLMERRPQWRAVRDALLGPRRGFGASLWTVILLRLPATPFAAVNLVLGSVGVPRGAVLLGTLVGMAPRSILAAALGAGVQQAFSKDAVAGPKWVIWVVAGVTAGVVLYLGHVGNKAIARLQAQGGQPGSPG